MNIMYAVDTLAISGGTERIIIEKANYLAEVFGYSVTIICFSQQKNTNNFYILSTLVKQINLGFKFHSQYNYQYPKRLWIKYTLYRRLKKALSTILQEVDPDILIGISHSQADIVSSMDCRAKKIIESHTPKFAIKKNTNNGSLIGNICKDFYNRMYISAIEKNADVIVTLTDKSKEEWTKAKRLEVIPNFSTMRVSKYSSCDNKQVIAIGRLCKEKGFDKLIDIWELANKKNEDWQLVIFGDGELKSEIAKKIKKKQLTNIKIHDPITNISEQYANSSICVVTSHFESFCLVILEAMKHGVPCVAFDCPYGPGSIIEDQKNGFLVENDNIALFTDQLTTLMGNENLRHKFSRAAILRANDFETDKIMAKWKLLFEELITISS